MGKRYESLTDAHCEFIRLQPLFFVGTAGDDTKVNISPKGQDSLRIINSNRVIWLNLTGSGNETAAHLLDNDRMTLMFCAFEGKPKILRLYGKAKTIHVGESEFDELYGLFPNLPGARQIFDLSIELVQTSCGMAVPLMEYQADREELNQWAEAKGEVGVQKYWSDKNRISLDGRSTGIATSPESKEDTN